MNKKTIVITGASSGLGQEVALLLRPDSLYLLSRHKPCDALKTGTWILCDISSKEQIMDACKKLPAEIDVFIHCAGIGLAKPLEVITHDEIDNVIQTNVIGTIYLTQEIYNRMVAQKFGHIIIVTSTSGKKPRENETVYCASKFAEAGFSEALHLEGMKHNIQVTTVYPGGMKTNFYTHMAPRNIEAFMDPKNVARQIVSIIDAPDNCVVSQITIERMG